MNRPGLVLSLCLAAPALTAPFFAAAPPASPATAPAVPPDTRRVEARETIHGMEFVDAYRWLEDQNSPETRAWIEAQNAYAGRLLDGRPALAGIQKRLSSLMKVDHVSEPVERGGRYFIWKKKADDDLPILYLRAGLEGADIVLIDPHKLSADHTTSVTLMDVAENGKRLVYGVRRGGGDEVEMRVMDVDNRTDLPDLFPNGLYDGVSLLPDGSGFYYTARTRAAGGRIKFHEIGKPPAADGEVYGEGHGPGDWLGAEVSEDGKYLLISVQHGWASSDVYVKSLKPEGQLRTVVEGEKALFEPWFAGDLLVIKTDLDAPRGRVVVVDLKDPAREKWRELVPQGPDAIQEIALAGGRIFVHRLHDVSSRLEIFSLEGKRLKEIPLPGLGTATVPTGRWAGREAFYTFQSFVVPKTTYRYDTSTGDSRIWARDLAPVDSSRFEVRQVWYPSKDGTKIPMFLVHRQGLQTDGDRPALLYGYGGFDVSLTPTFNPTAVWLAEQGGVYALANIRGGGEFGEEWHRAGMLGKKQNVFDDFIAAAEWLVAKRYTKPQRLAIRGGSNGGLLVGAALTQRPDIFAAVLCEYPDLDMVRYAHFDNNNPPALLEYGDARDPQQFKFLAAYSPYQKVAKGTAYPAVLLTTGDQDTRVPPLQARKMTAALQWASSSGKPVLLLYDTQSGHAGGRPFAKVVGDLSKELAFVSWRLGMETP